MVDVKQAIREVIAYFAELYPQMGNVHLEEVELSEDERFWYITIGYTPPNEKVTGLYELFGSKREYKIFKVNSETGKVISMKIREVAR